MNGLPPGIKLPGKIAIQLYQNDRPGNSVPPRWLASHVTISNPKRKMIPYDHDHTQRDNKAITNRIPNISFAKKMKKEPDTDQRLAQIIDKILIKNRKINKKHENNRRVNYMLKTKIRPLGKISPLRPNTTKSNEQSANSHSAPHNNASETSLPRPPPSATDNEDLKKNMEKLQSIVDRL